MKLASSISPNSIVKDEFDPASESLIKAFYKFKSLGGSDIAQVSSWTDQTGNFNMSHSGAEGESPSYTATDGAVTFNGSNQKLQSSSDIVLDEMFIIAIRASIEDPISNDVILADNTATGHFIRVKDSTTITIRIAGSTAQDFDLNTVSIVYATPFNLVISRDDDGLIKVFFNSVEQTDTNTRQGSFLLDALGVRKTDVNDLEGSIFEIQIYDGTSEISLIEKINDRLSAF